MSYILLFLGDEETEKCTYEAESPDEVAFLVATREFGFEFTKRTQTSVFVAELKQVCTYRFCFFCQLTNNFP